MKNVLDLTDFQIVSALDSHLVDQRDLFESIMSSWVTEGHLIVKLFDFDHVEEFHQCNSAIQTAFEFFHDRIDQKRRCYSKDRSKRGYSDSKSENFATLIGVPYQPNDTVEKFRIGPIRVPTPSNPSDEKYFNSKEGRIHFFPNTWPENPDFQSSVSNVYHQMERTMKYILLMIELAFDLPAGYFLPFIDKHTSILSLNFYDTPSSSSSCNSSSSSLPSLIPSLIEERSKSGTQDSEIGTRRVGGREESVPIERKEIREGELRVAEHTDVSLFTIVLEGWGRRREVGKEKEAGKEEEEEEDDKEEERAWCLAGQQITGMGTNASEEREEREERKEREGEAREKGEREGKSGKVWLGGLEVRRGDGEWTRVHPYLPTSLPLQLPSPSTSSSTSSSPPSSSSPSSSSCLFPQTCAVVTIGECLSYWTRERGSESRSESRGSSESSSGSRGGPLPLPPTLHRVSMIHPSSPSPSPLSHSPVPVPFSPPLDRLTFAYFAAPNYDTPLSLPVHPPRENEEKRGTPLTYSQWRRDFIQQSLKQLHKNQLKER